MAVLTINGQQFHFEGKKPVLQIAIENGAARSRAFGTFGLTLGAPVSAVENDAGIPYYCYHPGLSVVGSCRLCLAEISIPNPRTRQLEPIPKLLPTCSTTAVDGMVVLTRTPKAIANQKFCMECFLLSHPLDCPVCDKAGECKLQDYSYRYGRSESRFIEDKVKNPVKDIGPTVKLYADRCVFCSRCIRFCQEVAGTAELGWIGRGASQEIDIFPGKPLANELAANVVDLCPVGALVEKDFLFQQRAWYLIPVPSIDGITASGDNIWIDQSNDRIYRIRPRTNPEINKWWISDEIRSSWKQVHSKQRLLKPTRLQSGTQAECSWENACQESCERFARIVKKGGPGSLVLLASPMLSCEEAYLLAQYVRTMDPAAILGIGPIPVRGYDKTFPGGYTLYAEKCPNSRGVRKALQLVADRDPSARSPHEQSSSGAPEKYAPAGVLTFSECLKLLTDANNRCGGVLVTGNYPKPWTSDVLQRALNGKFIVAIDTLCNDVTATADVTLSGATWTEKSGTFLNARNYLQSFERAILPIGEARSEGQIACDLLAACEHWSPSPFDAGTVRRQMGGTFVSDVRYPDDRRPSGAGMHFIEL